MGVLGGCKILGVSTDVHGVALSFVRSARLYSGRIELSSGHRSTIRAVPGCLLWCRVIFCDRPSSDIT